MNRELKFRAFIAGEMKPIAILHNTPHPARVLDMDFSTNHINATLFPVETPVMQYTGVRDKSKKEIYEGDIMRRISSEGAKDETEVLCQVLYSDGSFWRQLITDSRPFYYRVTLCSGHYHDEKWEIIGNKHQNPDLLK